MQVIGICGFIGSGKNTVGKILQEAGYKPVSFAETLKDATSVIFGWERALLEGDTDESRKFREQPDEFWSGVFGYEFTPRFAMQKMGTEAGRNVFGEQIWVESVVKKMYDIIKSEGETKFVITDVRFENEIKTIERLGGKIFEVARGESPEWYDCALRTKSGAAPKYERMEVLYPKIHISEWDWITVKKSGIIWNNKDLEHLHNEVNRLILNEENNATI